MEGGNIAKESLLAKVFLCDRNISGIVSGLFVMSGAACQVKFAGFARENKPCQPAARL
jgi:hypothetical protein